MNRPNRLSALLVLSLTVCAGSAQAGAPKDHAPGAAHVQSTEPAPLDLNRAKREQLKTLPGVTDAVATRIIAGRPYLSKAFLVTNNIVSPDVYDAIRNLVVARPPRAMLDRKK